MTYRELYFHLFGVVEDAVDAFEALLEALRDGEEAHMNQDILPDRPVPET